jgi:transcription elongation factor Elf1
VGRRRKKEEKVLRRTLPEMYLCPRCGKNTVKAVINRKKERVVIICSNCRLSGTVPYQPNTTEVDAYCSFVDRYYREGGEAQVVE